MKLFNPNNNQLLILLLLAGLPLFTACNASLQFFTADSNITLSDNAALTVNERISIKPGHTRVFFQDGIIVSQFNHYKHNCNLEVRKKDSDNFQFIEPGTYGITGIQDTLEEVVRLAPRQPVKLALHGDTDNQLTRSLVTASVDGDGLSDIYLGMHFYLSGEDTNVMRLSCRGALAAPQDALPPTLAEIRQALGNLLTLSL